MAVAVAAVMLIAVAAPSTKRPSEDDESDGEVEGDDSTMGNSQGRHF